MTNKMKNKLQYEILIIAILIVINSVSALAQTCSTGLTANAVTAGYSAGSASPDIYVQPTTCTTYTVNTNGYSWISYTKQGPRVTISVTSNTGGTRSGTIYIDGRSVTVTQTGCSAVAPTSITTDRNNFCANAGGNITLTPVGGSGTTLRWFTGSCGGTEITTTTGALVIAAPTVTTTYYARWETTCGNSTCASVTVSVNPLPNTPGSISGSTSVCQSQTGVVYSIAPISGVTGYSWTVPANAYITAGSNTNSITVTIASNSTSGNVTVSGVNSCGTGPASSLPVTVNTVPGAAGTITGATTVCKGQSGVTYSVPAISNATGYSWSLPTGASITAGSNTNSITVTYSSGAASGNVTVLGTNTCGNGPGSSLAVTVNSVPDAAGTITGTSSVCQGQSGVAYSVPAITNATSYGWNLPTGATISSGSGTRSITVSYASNAVSGNISVYGINSCGNGTASSNFPVSVGTLPNTPGSISGSTSVCQSQTGVVYTIAPISNVTGYTWTLPANAWITAGSNTNSITVTIAANSTSGNVTVSGVNSCGTGPSSSLAVTVNTLPSAAGTIIGTATVCQGQTGVTYSVPAIANATGYSWSLPTGASITSGANTNTITVSYSASASSGNITVTGTDMCGNGPTSANFAVTVSPIPVAAGTITGTATVCQGQSGVTYSVPSITNATGYTWTLPTGASITAGSNTNSITVSYGSSAASGNITVYGTNSCGNGTVSANYAVTVNPLPSAAGTITGTATVCQGQTGITYTVPSISNATGYSWSLPTGASISAGSNTNSITVTYSSSAVSGNITVRGTNSCGNGTVSSNYAVTVNPLPAAAGTITGTSAVCPGQTGVTYSVPAISNATGYTWTLPTGASITSGSNTNSITVTYSLSAVSGNITVKGTNSCGNGTVSSNYAVTVNLLPGAAGTITGTATVCQGQTGVTYSVPSISNATGYTWTLPTGASITSGSNTNNITVTYSASAVSGNITVAGTNSCGNGTVSANYAVTINPLPSAAGTITGTASVCQGLTGVNYSVPAITNATGYSWTLPSGASITAGSNTRSITVSYSLSATSGNVTVRGTNSCGNGTVSANFAVTVTAMPGAAGTITGTSSVCQGQTGVTYTVPSISNATGYTWTVPSGASITSGSNTNTITVTFGAGSISGNVTVLGTNSCGSGTSSSFPVSITSAPGLSGLATSVSGPVCSGSDTQVSLSATTLAAGVYSVNYTLSGANSGTYTATLTVSSGNSGTFNTVVLSTTGTTVLTVNTVSAGSCTSTATSGNTASISVSLCYSDFNINYIKETTIDTALSDISLIPSLTVRYKQIKYSYMDGLGRPLQTVLWQNSPAKKDLIQPIEYDALGREATKYLPYTGAGNNGAFHPTALVNGTYSASEQYKYYQTGDPSHPQAVVGDNYPFALTVFEMSPLNRPTSQGSAGSDWQPSIGHVISIDYGTNTGSEVSLWKIVTDSVCQQIGTYGAGELYVNQTTDENGNVSKEYKDKDGKVVLKRVYNGLEIAQTFYVYDDFGMLRYVIPPKAANSLATNILHPSDPFVKEGCYYYRYDSRKRLITKQLPGAKPVYMVYDIRDRLVLVQDGRQRKNSEWLYTKYDVLNQPVMSGVIQITDALTLPLVQAKVDTYYTVTYPNEANRYEIPDASTIGYTTGRSFPNSVTESGMLTTTYYGSYSYNGVIAFNSAIGVTSYNSRVTGKQTGGKIKNLSANTWLVNSTYYDEKFRAIQVVKANHLSGIDCVTNKIDFPGKIQQSYSTHTGVQAVNTTRVFDYDHAGRLLRIRHQIGSNSQVSLSYMQYNELGQLVDKKLHSTDSQYANYLQSIDYRYNIRGWLININNIVPGSVPSSDDSVHEKPDVFGMEFKYNTIY